MYEKMQMVSLVTRDRGDFPFAAGLLSGCESNQNIMDDTLRVDNFNGGFGFHSGEHDQ